VQNITSIPEADGERGETDDEEYFDLGEGGGDDEDEDEDEDQDEDEDELDEDGDEVCLVFNLIYYSFILTTFRNPSQVVKELQKRAKRQIQNLLVSEPPETETVCGM
jgi:hypothetical protein